MHLARTPSRPPRRPGGGGHPSRLDASLHPPELLPADAGSRPPLSALPPDSQDGRSTAHAAFLRQVPILAGLSDALRERLSGELREVRVPAGQWVFREGDEADSLFIVRSGRVEVVAEGPPESLLRILRRGEVLGELALLREGTRSASVRARRDAVLLELARGPFEALILDAPTFALGLTRAMGAQLASSRTPVFTATPPRTIAVVGLDDGAGATDLARRLAGELGRQGTVACLTAAPGETEPEAMAGLDRAEREHDRVVLAGAATAPGDPWTDLCLREAETVVAVTSGAPAPAWLGRPDALVGCELLATGRAVPEDLVERLSPRELHVVPSGAALQGALEVLARRLAGRAIGIVFSGGGARAMAHIGVLEELRAAGVVLDRVGGVSLGALVGASAAMGLPDDEIEASFRRFFVDENPTSDVVPPVYALLRGGKTRRGIAQAFGARRIEELPLRFFCVSCDLVAREAIVHRTGSVAEATYASLAIPGIFPPVPGPDGRLLVDGGVIDNLPVATMARSGEGPVIAVDVTGRMGRFEGRRRPRQDRLGRRVRQLLTGSPERLPRLGETVLRTVTVGSSDTVEAARRHADVVVTPGVDGVGLLDWHRLDAMREAGRRAARATLRDAGGLLGV